MNAERLLQLYDRVSEAPDSIPRLRRFILDLAVLGKLIEQDPEDEPASELVKRLPEEQLRLFQSGKIKKPVSKEVQSLTSLKDAPSNWSVVRGTDLFPTRSGNSKLIKGRLYSEPGPKRYPGYSAAGQDVWLDDWEHEGTAIILSAVGARCGKAFLAARRWSAIANTHVIWVMPEITAPAYAMLNLNNEDFWVRSGGAQPFVKVRATLEKPFHLPPLAEQHRIVAKVDELMGLCDSLEAGREKREATRDRLTTTSLNRLTAPDVDEKQFKAHADFAIKVLPDLTTRPDQIKRLRQTILDLAVRGKLVEQDPNDEPANELLKKIKAAKEARVRSGAFPQVKPPVELMNPELELSIPAGWLWVRLGDVIKVWNGFAFKSSDFRTEGIPVIRIGDLQNGGVMLANAKRVSSDVARSVDSNFWIPEGSLLIAMSGATTGKTAINLNKEGLLLNQRVGRIESFGMSIRFVRVFFETIIARNLSIASGTAIPNLSTQQLNATAIPLPPLAEQKRIIAKVDELMALCDQLEQGLDLRRGTQSHLLEGLTNGALHSLITEAA